MLERSKGPEDPVDPLVGLDTRDGEHTNLVALHMARPEFLVTGQAPHSSYGGVHAKDTAAFRLEIIAGDDRLATGA